MYPFGDVFDCLLALSLAFPPPLSFPRMPYSCGILDFLPGLDFARARLRTRVLITIFPSSPLLAGKSLDDPSPLAFSPLPGGLWNVKKLTICGFITPPNQTSEGNLTSFQRRSLLIFNLLPFLSAYLLKSVIANTPPFLPRIFCCLDSLPRSSLPPAPSLYISFLAILAICCTSC